MRRLNHISFGPSWAKGLAQLLEKLETDAVPKRASFNPEAVGSLWRRKFDANRGVTDEPEDYLSNWFPITRVPEKLHRHYVAGDEIGKIEMTLIGSPTPLSKTATFPVHVLEVDENESKRTLYLDDRNPRRA